MRHVKSKKALRAMILFNMMRDKTQSEMKTKKLMKGKSLLSTTTAGKHRWKNAVGSLVNKKDKSLDMFKVTYSAARKISEGSNTFRFNHSDAAAKTKLDKHGKVVMEGDIDI